MEKPSTDAAFSDPASDLELVETRPVRWSGIVALLLGIASLTALVSPLLLPIPLAALVLGLVALRPADADQGRPVGQRVAVWGMTLAALFGGWSVASRITREQHLETTAVEFAQSWLQVLSRGEVELAFELTLPARLRQLPSTPLREFYAQSVEREDHPWKQFQHSDLVYEVAAAGQPQWELAGEPSHSRRYGIDHVSLVMRDQSESVSSDVRIGLAREVDPETGIAEWIIEDFEVVAPPSLTGNRGFAN